MSLGEVRFSTRWLPNDSLHSTGSESHGKTWPGRFFGSAEVVKAPWPEPHDFSVAFLSPAHPSKPISPAGHPVGPHEADHRDHKTHSGTIGGLVAK